MAIHNQEEETEMHRGPSKMPVFPVEGQPRHTKVAEVIQKLRIQIDIKLFQTLQFSTITRTKNVIKPYKIRKIKLSLRNDLRNVWPIYDVQVGNRPVYQYKCVTFSISS